MKAETLITPETVIPDLLVSNKFDALALLADRASLLIHLSQAEIYKALVARESQGSTGLGMGAAMPHAHFGIMKSPFALFARATRAMDFHALDGRPVDLVFLLLGPEPPTNSYLRLLVATSRALRDPSVRERLRSSSDAFGIVKTLVEAIDQKTRHTFA